MLTITDDQRAAIVAKLAGMHIPSGLGTEDEACSVAAINLALTGELTDEIPDCMSVVIGKWIIDVQDEMPADMRNGDEWRGLLPLAAGTGREHEQERAEIIMEWMWDALSLVQPIADEDGFGNEWRTMCTERTAEAAENAASAAAKAADAAAYAAASAANAAKRAANAANAANMAAAAADAVAYAAEAAPAAAEAAAYAAEAAAYAAEAAPADFWRQVNPPALLRKLINVTHEMK